MKIYTKTGDDGTTGLQGNKRVSKSNPRIMAYGSVDEANAVIGLVLTLSLDDDVKNNLEQIQNELFVVGADLSNSDLSDQKTRVTKDMTENLEKQIDMYENELRPLSNFILPGGDAVSAQIHFARTVIRRAETYLVSLMESEKINSNSLHYLNRLSDLLFVLARVVNKRKGKQDIIWKI